MTHESAQLAIHGQLGVAGPVLMGGSLDPRAITPDVEGIRAGSRLITLKRRKTQVDVFGDVDPFSRSFVGLGPRSGSRGVSDGLERCQNHNRLAAEGRRRPIFLDAIFDFNSRAKKSRFPGFPGALACTLTRLSLEGFRKVDSEIQGTANHCPISLWCVVFFVLDRASLKSQGQPLMLNVARKIFPTPCCSVSAALVAFPLPTEPTPTRAVSQLPQGRNVGATTPARTEHAARRLNAFMRAKRGTSPSRANRGDPSSDCSVRRLRARPTRLDD